MSSALIYAATAGAMLLMLAVTSAPVWRTRANKGALDWFINVAC